MEPLVLTNKDEFPSEELIFSHIGKNKTHWISIFDHIQNQYPKFIEEWRYYNDGKSWLLKIVQKKKTICWVSVFQNKFKMTFYFTDRGEQAIMESSISDELKEQFKTGKYYNKIRALTITFSSKKTVNYAKILIDIKLSIK